MLSLLRHVLVMTAVTSVAQAVILNLIPACPGAITGQAILDLKTDANAYGLAKCANGEKFFTQISEVEYSINGTFEEDYAGEYCQFQKKKGINTFALEVEIGWGESDGGSTTVINKTERHVVTCVFDIYGMGIIENSSVLKPFLAPKEIQRLLGIPCPRAVFELKVLDILDNDITNTAISLGRKIRLKVIENNSTAGLGCRGGFSLIKDRCYYISSHVGSYSYSSADDYCISIGSELVAVETKEEFMYIKNFFDDNGIQGSFITSGIIVAPSMAFWTTTGEEVISDGDCWFPGYSLETATDDCIILQSMWGETGLEDTSCRSASGRSVMCEDIEPAQPDETQRADFFKALSCEARNSFTSYAILRAGCGDGQVFGKEMGFETDGETVYSPYFESFRLQGEESVHYQCNFTICKTRCDGDSCSLEDRRKRETEAENQSDNIMVVRTEGVYGLEVKDAYYSFEDPEIIGDLVVVGKTIIPHASNKKRKTNSN